MVVINYDTELHVLNNKFVLHLISGDLWAGAEVQVYHTLASMRQTNEFIPICVLFNDGLLARKLLNKNVACIVIDENTANSFMMLFHLVKIIKKYSPVIVHAHHIKEHFLGLMACKIAGFDIPIFRTLHGLSAVPPHLPLKKHIRSTIVVYLDKLLTTYFTDYVIAVSKDLRERLKRQGTKAAIHHVYNAIDVADYPVKDGHGLSVRNKYGVDKDCFWIGTAARLAAPKNLPMLIRTAKRLFDQGINFHVSIFGDGPLGHRLEEMIHTQGVENLVTLHGFEKEIVPVLTEIDAFVLCSKHEGLPMALLEAMAVGTPVVCTAVGGMKEVITHRSNGLTVPDDDDKALCDSLIELYRNPDLASSLVANGQETIRDKYSIEGAVNRLRGLYQAAIH